MQVRPGSSFAFWFGCILISAILVWIVACLAASRDRVILESHSTQSPWVVRVVSRPSRFFAGPIDRDNRADFIAVFSKDGSDERWELTLEQGIRFTDGVEWYGEASWEEPKLYLRRRRSPPDEIDLTQRKLVKAWGRPIWK